MPAQQPAEETPAILGIQRALQALLRKAARVHNLTEAESEVDAFCGCLEDVLQHKFKTRQFFMFTVHPWSMIEHTEASFVFPATRPLLPILREIRVVAPRAVICLDLEPERNKALHKGFWYLTLDHTAEGLAQLARQPSKVVRKVLHLARPDLANHARHRVEQPEGLAHERRLHWVELGRGDARAELLCIGEGAALPLLTEAERGQGSRQARVDTQEPVRRLVRG